MAAYAFYRGNRRETYLFSRGNVSIFTVVYPSDPRVIAGVAFIFIEPPGLTPKKYEVRIRKMQYDLTSEGYELAGISDPEEFAAQDTFRLAEAWIADEQVKIFDDKKSEAALKPLEFATCEDWKQELLRLRLRGLSEELLHRMSNEVGAEVGTFLKQLTNFRPIQTIDAGQ